MYPPLAFVIAEQEDIPDRGGDAEPAESEHFLSNNLKSCEVEGGGSIQEGRCRGSGCLPVGLVSGGGDAKCQITRSVQGM